MYTETENALYKEIVATIVNQNKYEIHFIDNRGRYYQPHENIRSVYELELTIRDDYIKTELEQKLMNVLTVPVLLKHDIYNEFFKKGWVASKEEIDSIYNYIYQYYLTKLTF